MCVNVKSNTGANFSALAPINTGQRCRRDFDGDVLCSSNAETEQNADIVR